MTIKKFKSANLNLPASQFNKKESFDFGSLFLESRDLKIGRAFGTFVSYRLAKVSRTKSALAGKGSGSKWQLFQQKFPKYPLQEVV